MDKENSLRQLFPDSLKDYFDGSIKRFEDLSEIHIRCNQPVLISRRKQEFFLCKKNGVLTELEADQRWLEASTSQKKNKLENEIEEIIFDARQIEAVFLHICRYSPYAFQDELRQGFITVHGGHRVGVAGQVLCQNGEVKEIRNICFLNIRIAHEIKGVADECMPYLYNQENGMLRSCLIIASPGCGKTTLLRDMIRQISNGNQYGQGKNVGVVDERSEIAGCFMGIPQNDIGTRSDVLDGCPKSEGMQMLLRSMAPQVIAVDEIATAEDVRNLLLLLHSGIKVLVTVHGSNLDEVMQKPFLKPLFEYRYFELFLVISGNGIEKTILNS